MLFCSPLLPFSLQHYSVLDNSCGRYVVKQENRFCDAWVHTITNTKYYIGHLLNHAQSKLRVLLMTTIPDYNIL